MNELTYKKSFSTIIGVTVFILFFYAAIIYILDPLQQFRMASFLKPVYTNETYQNPGLAKNFDYDTVIIGTSMTENFKPSYIKKQLGWQTVKLSVSGTNAFEEKIMLTTALLTGKVRNVVLGIDVLNLNENEIRSGYPYYLYSNSYLHHLKYLFNAGNLSFIIKSIIAKLGLGYDGETNLDMAYNWENRYVFSSQNVRNAFEEQIEHVQPAHYSFNKMQAVFDKNLLAIFKNYPNVHFYIFFPPYSIYQYKLYQASGALLPFLQMKTYIFSVTKNLANVKLYDYQAEKKITCHLENYKDVSHYSRKINDFIIDSFLKPDYLVRENNMKGFDEKVLLASGT